MKQCYWFLIFLMILGLSSWERSRVSELDQNLELFNSVVRTIDEFYVEDVDANALVINAIDYTVESLDPYSFFFDKEETIQREKYSWNGILYAGIGVTLDLLDEVVTVIGVREGYGAQQNDIRVGDQIIQVEEESTLGLTVFEAADLIKGKKGETVNLTIKRGKKKLVKRVERQFIEDRAVPYFDQFDSTGYIKFNHFLRGSASKLREAVITLKDNGAEQLILDMRGNYGGLISEAVNASSLFVDVGSGVMSQKGKHAHNNYSNDTENIPVALDIPILVLIDSLTISAAEIFTGAMQDHDRMVIAGTTSAGKGIVQGTYYPGLETSMFMTVSAYYTPSGRSVQNLDYPSRYLSRNPVKVDSTKKDFKTSNGRPVASKGGIEPDILIDWEVNSPYIYFALNSPLTFDFLNQYANRSSKDEINLDFEFEPREFERIFNSLLESSDSIPLRMDGTIANLKEEWETLGGEELVELAEIKRRVKELKSKGLMTAKPEIKKVLESEIVRRFYFEKGYYNNKFVRDLKRYDFNKYFDDYDSILNGK